MSPSSSAAPAPSPNPTAFTVTSADFADGEELDVIHTADAFSGQCTGDNINPALAWSNPPQGTVTFAIAMTDESASGWVHWVHANIPADVTSVEQGGSSSLPGVAGRDQATGEAGYFGPCPPGPDHRYVFTVYALDAELALEPRFSGLDLTLAMSGHILGEAAITGMRSGPA
jgi:Raf kinase inhibitor-like YbhB/YbcL family protein